MYQKTTIALLLSLFCITAFAKNEANLENGVILKGYDSVSYFKNKPSKGNPEFKFQDGEVTYLFSNAENLAEFKKSPEKYKPAYGGWCATAVVKEKKVDIDPTNYKITNGRLFLFYREEGLFGGDAKPDWIENEPANTIKADKNWPKIKDKE
ncbi:MAG: YHS domain-containing (seleno)protein [Pseudobdellovibrio sp.]